MEVVRAAWKAMGRPTVHGGKPGMCSHCGRQEDVYPARTAVSKKFTSFDTWSNPDGTSVCAACYWAYTTDSLRAQSHIVHADGRLEVASKHDLGLWLAKPLPSDLAILIPLIPNRQHIVPIARFGHVTTEAGALVWSPADSRRLEIVQELRTMGASVGALYERVVPYRLLRSLPQHEWEHLLQLWRGLDDWRFSARAWLDVAAFTTTAEMTAPETAPVSA